MRISVKVALDHTTLLSLLVFSCYNSNSCFTSMVVACNGLRMPLPLWPVLKGNQCYMVQLQGTDQCRSGRRWRRSHLGWSTAAGASESGEFRLILRENLNKNQQFADSNNLICIIIWYNLLVRRSMVQIGAVRKYVNGVSCLKHFVTCQERRIQ